jgi:CDP-glycerol glycerophosphotransferase
MENQNKSPGSPEARLAALEQKLAQIEQVIGLLAEAEKSAVGAIQQALTKFSALERGTGAVRTRQGLENASRIFPKTKTVIFVAKECGGASPLDYFGDNIKYAYLSFCAAAKSSSVACYFLTDSERVHQQLTAANLPCLPWFVPDWTAEHLRILLGAKVAVLCNIFYPVDERGYFPYALLRGATTIQLWHGIPLKEVGMESLFPAASYHPRIAEVLGASGPFDIFAGTAAGMREEWARRFAFRRYEASGYPRTDILFRDVTPQDMIGVDTETHRLVEAAARDKKPVILYAPTFRDAEFGVWFKKAGIEAVAEHCAARGYVFCVNLHPIEGPFIGEFRKQYPRIRFLEPLTDIYPLLKHVGVLVTDYSSIAFDFLLCDRPILFYQPDHAEYIARSRPLIEGHEKYFCGPVTQDAAELSAAIDTAAETLKNPAGDTHKDARAALRKRLYDHGDGNAGERLNALILKTLEA